MSSGGGGGDGGAAARQQQIERQKQQARDKVNAMFGVAPSMDGITPGSYTTTKEGKLVANPWSGYIGDSSLDLGGNVLSGLFGGKKNLQKRSTFNQAGYQAAIDEYNKEASDAAANKAARQSLYDTVRQNAFDVGKTGLDENKTTAARNTKFSLFAQGLNGGSEDINQNALLDRTYNKGLLDLGAKADATRTDMQSADEKTRLGLLQSIDSGVDQNSAITSAINQLQTNADRAASEAQGNTLGDLFAESGLLYNRSKAAQGRQAATTTYPFGYQATPAGANLGSSGRVTSDFNNS